jgi:hypothetical protein
VVEGRGVGEGKGKEEGLRVTWEQPGENGGGGLVGRELRGNGEDGIGN